jgi:hypothetical protein
MKKIYKYINYILAPLMLFIIFTACGNEPDYDESMSSPRMMSSPESASLMTKEVSSGPVSQGSDQLTNISERKISKNAQLEIKVKSLDDSMNFITNKTNSYKGYIVSSSSYAPNTDYETKTANISLRVPSDSLDQFLIEIKTYAKETIHESIFTQDITEEYIDVKAKITSMESSEQRLTKLLDKTESVNEIVEVEKELSRLRGEIDSLKGRFKFIENSVVTSLIHIYMEEIPNPVSISDPSWNTRDIALDAIKALSSFGQFIVSVIVFIFVFTPVWILIAGLIYGTKKLRNRNK